MIAQRLEAPPLVIVRTEPAKGAIDNRNVYGVAASGEIVWRIEESALVYEDSPYVNVARKPDGYHAYNWDGGDTLFDCATGKILSVRQGK